MIPSNQKTLDCYKDSQVLPMMLQVEFTLVDLVDLAPDYDAMVKTQADTYRLMLAIAAVRSDESRPNFISERMLLRLLGLRVPEALYCRLRNLQKKGYCKLLQDPDFKTA